MFPRSFPGLKKLIIYQDWSEATGVPQDHSKASLNEVRSCESGVWQYTREGKAVIELVQSLEKTSSGLQLIDSRATYDVPAPIYANNILEVWQKVVGLLDTKEKRKFEVELAMYINPEMASSIFRDPGGP